MKIKAVMGVAGIFLLSFSIKNDFLAEQKKNARVKTAINEKQELLKKKLEEHKLSFDNLNVLFVAYKEDKILDVYARTKEETAYQKIASYAICSRSGNPGPKKKQGDGQVPEGFYHIERFNPNSSFYLSLGISYPNLADKRKSKGGDLGGDIFIHGNCVTIGCLPMTDDFIKEIYLLAVYAKNNGQDPPVYIFPFKMTEENLSAYKAKYKDKELAAFWDNLKTGYDMFMKDKKELTIHVSENGSYTY